MPDSAPARDPVVTPAVPTAAAGAGITAGSRLFWSTPAARGRTLLLVEDSRHAAEAVRLLARRLGMRLRRAEDLAAARAHLRVYRPDVALVDLGLPDGSGLDLLAELAALRPALRRIVAISADPAAGPEALAAGACAFVAKPLRLPADLPTLFGPGCPTLPDPHQPRPDVGRNAGGDPMALRDDLVRARAVLERAAQARGDPDGLDYAAGFVQGLARCVGDDGLQAAARRARESRDVVPLMAEIAARTHRLDACHLI